MRIAVSSDERTGVAERLIDVLKARGHEVLAHGALAARAGANEGERSDCAGAQSEQWAWASEAAARAVADGRADMAVVCCFTGTGASIAANKVRGVRAALCADAATAAGARRWNAANVLALSLRTTSDAQLAEILDSFLGTAPSTEEEDCANVAHVHAIEAAGAPRPARANRAPGTAR